MSSNDLPRGVDGPFENLRGKLGFTGESFPARYAQIFWNLDQATDTNCQVSVCFVPRNVEGFNFFENRNTAFMELCRDAFFDMGNSAAGWFENARPAEVFGSMLRRGFCSTDELVRALQEFSRLYECGWAREMLLAYPDFEDEG